MKKTSIKSHLSKYSIFQKRATTINHAFASAMAPVDEYSDERIDRVLSELECLRDGEIYCVYCGEVKAETWDHLFALVKDNKPSGYGHKYGNLIPCCKNCNSKKGNQDWRVANERINQNNPTRKSEVNRIIANHIRRHPPKGKSVPDSQREKLFVIKDKILRLMKDADEILNSAR